MDKNIRKNLPSKQRQKILYDAKQSAADAIKTISKREAAEVMGDLIGNKIGDKITRASKTF